jgi:hypothetical protein
MFFRLRKARCSEEQWVLQSGARNTLNIRSCSRDRVGRDSSVGIGGTVRGSNPGGGEIFSTRPDRPWGLPSLMYNRYRIVALTTHPHLAPRLKKEYSYTSTPGLGLHGLF